MGWQENFIPRPPLRQTRVHWCLWIHKCHFVGDSNQLRLLQECIFFFRWRTWRNAPSVSYWSCCFIGCSAFHLPPRDLLKKARTRNLPSGLSAEVSKIPFQSYCSHHFWNLQIGTEMKIWGWNHSGFDTMGLQEVRINWTGCMPTLIGAVQSTGGYCLWFSGSQIAALTMPKQETSILFF